MNKALTSLNTFFLILLFLSLIFSMFSIPNLNIDQTQSIKVNFYELIQQDEILLDPSASNTLIKKETKKLLTIENLINSIFDLEFRNYISSVTGFNYSIDYLIMYERKFIEKKKREKNTLEQWYSYKWHFDKPNSSNMLKIFVPINIENGFGPLEAIYKNKSKSLNNLNKIDASIEREFFLGSKDTIFGFYPTLCCHRDGIPNKNKTGTQIMFQLNPNKKWAINKRLFSDNSSTNKKLGIWTEEPKFPFFSYFFDERLLFDN